MIALVSSPRIKVGRNPMTVSTVPGYELTRKLAEGGFAEIYEGKRTMGTDRVAIKILHPRHVGNKMEHRRLLDEGALGKRLGLHEHVVETLDVGTVENLPYVILELLPGRTLRELIRTRRQLSDREVIELSRALARAMRFMHNAGIYHRDMKPENVMLDGNGLIKVIDLGFAESHLAVKFSFFGRRLDGSPAYMAPEYIRTRKPSIGSDVYALGCTLYEAATGIPPMVGSSDKEVLSKQVNMSVKPDSIQAANPDIHPHTEKLIMRAVEKDTEKRYKSVDEFLLELSRNPLFNEPDRGIEVPANWLDR